jgi:hypothetical protein
MKRLVVFAVLFVLVGVHSIGMAAPSTTGPTAPAQVLGITHGAHVPPTVEYGQAVKNFNTLVGKDIGVVMYFMDWSTGDNATGKFMDPWLLNRLRATLGDGSPVVMLTWQPMNGRATIAGKPACDRDYGRSIPLDALINGACDNYIRGFAQTLKERPERFILRFAHEMNIADMPWWPGNYGQDASKYIAMYRHVHDVFKSQGATNVEWMWSPNYMSNPVVDWNDLYNYYPGDAYVDWIGLSGYNWNRGGVPWRSFSWLYDATLNGLSCRYAKPQIIAEIGTVDGGGGDQSKVGWINETYSQAPNYPFLRGIVWFNDYAMADPSGPDFRVTAKSGDTGVASPLPAGSGAWTDAYKASISSSTYISSLPSLGEATPPRTYCGGGTGVTLKPSSKMLKPGESTNISVEAMLLDSDQSLSLSVPGGAGLKGSVSPQTLEAPWGSAAIKIETSSSTPEGTYNLTLKTGQGDIPFQVTVSKKITYTYIPSLHH